MLDKEKLIIVVYFGHNDDYKAIEEYISYLTRIFDKSTKIIPAVNNAYHGVKLEVLNPTYITDEESKKIFESKIKDLEEIIKNYNKEQ